MLFAGMRIFGPALRSRRCCNAIVTRLTIIERHDCGRRYLFAVPSQCALISDDLKFPFIPSGGRRSLSVSSRCRHSSFTGSPSCSRWCWRRRRRRSGSWFAAAVRRLTFGRLARDDQEEEKGDDATTIFRSRIQDARPRPVQFSGHRSPHDELSHHERLG